MAATSKPLFGGLFAVVVVGVLVVIYSIVVDPPVGWAGLLVGAVFGLTIAVGAALFAAINVVTGATWWYPLRGSSMRVARTLVVPAVALGLLLAFGVRELYPWAQGHGHFSHSKAIWLSVPVFVGLTVVILLLWFGLVSALRKQLAQSNPKGLLPTAIGFLVVFAVTISVGFWQWTMSLEPTWFSTMHGVYGFAGSLQVGIAATALVWLARRRKPVHELGTLLFSFSLFWGYIWYSQAMLIWYANLPEETVHYAHRLTGDWTMLFWLNPILNLVIPVVVLLSRHAKRSRFVVGQVAIVIVVGHFLDILLLVGPAVGTATLLPWTAVGAAVAMVSAMLLIPQRQPNKIANSSSVPSTVER